MIDIYSKSSLTFIARYICMTRQGKKKVLVTVELWRVQCCIVRDYVTGLVRSNRAKYVGWFFEWYKCASLQMNEVGRQFLTTYTSTSYKFALYRLSGGTSLSFVTNV